MIYIQNTWKEDEDTQMCVEFFLNQNIPFIHVNCAEISSLNLNENDCLFCDSDLFYKCLSPIVIKQLPTTYPPCFDNTLYGRKIEIHHVDNIKNMSFPFFCKPYIDKEFMGLIIKNKYDIQYVLDNSSGIVFVSDCVTFHSEYRLYIINFELFYMHETTSYVSPARFTINNNNTAVKPNDLFIKRVLQQNTYHTCVIDIGYNFNVDSFCIVEVNPPFSLSLYDMPIKKYYEYCQATCKYLFKK